MRLSQAAVYISTSFCSMKMLQMFYSFSECLWKPFAFLPFMNKAAMSSSVCLFKGMHSRSSGEGEVKGMNFQVQNG